MTSKTSAATGETRTSGGPLGLAVIWPMPYSLTLIGLPKQQMAATGLATHAAHQSTSGSIGAYGVFISALAATVSDDSVSTFEMRMDRFDEINVK